MAESWKIDEVQRNVHVLRFPRAKEWWMLLLSDVHWDNIHCDRALIKRHLDQAKDRKAVVTCAGDFFCAMQGRWDKRASKSDLRPELQTENYLDALVDQAAEWLLPYKDILGVWGDGNHETGIVKRHETNIADRLCDRMRSMGSQVRHGGYCGWVRLRFTEPGGRHPEDMLLFYHHGAGADPAVTKGQIEQERMAAWLRGADIVHTGHIHQHTYTRTMSVSLSCANKVVIKPIHWIRSGSYIDSYQAGGYHIERNRGPRPMGGWWVKFSVRNHQIVTEVTATE